MTILDRCKLVALMGWALLCGLIGTGIVVSGALWLTSLAVGRGFGRLEDRLVPWTVCCGIVIGAWLGARTAARHETWLLSARTVCVACLAGLTTGVLVGVISTKVLYDEVAPGDVEVVVGTIRIGCDALGFALGVLAASFMPRRVAQEGGPANDSARS